MSSFTFPPRPINHIAAVALDLEGAAVVTIEPKRYLRVLFGDLDRNSIVAVKDMRPSVIRVATRLAAKAQGENLSEKAMAVLREVVGGSYAAVKIMTHLIDSQIPQDPQSRRYDIELRPAGERPAKGILVVQAAPHPAELKFKGIWGHQEALRQTPRILLASLGTPAEPTIVATTDVSRFTLNCSLNSGVTQRLGYVENIIPG